MTRPWLIPIIAAALALAAGWISGAPAGESGVAEPPAPAVIAAPEPDPPAARGIEAIQRVWSRTPERRTGRDGRGREADAGGETAGGGEAAPRWRFAGVVETDGAQAALFIPPEGGEGVLVREGDTLPDGAVVALIEPTRVVFEGETGEARLFRGRRD